MRIRYSQWDDSFFRKLKGMRDLLSIFNQLLLKFNGDVDIALDIMEQLRNMGALPPGSDLDEFKRNIQERKLVLKQKHGMSLTPKGERALRRDAFERIFESLKNGGAGEHSLRDAGGQTGEALPERRQYRFGDSISTIDFRQSLLNAVTRNASLAFNMNESDLEVLDTEMATTCSTVLLIDISHSMVLYGEDRITPAKQIALALSELIMTEYRKDSLNVVLFGDHAREVQVKDLPYISAGPFHTNTKAGLEVARQILLRKKSMNKQIFMITDGKPSVIVKSNGTVYRNSFGLDPVIVNRTLDEAIICRKKKITITTFMIADDPYLQNFVQQLTELNRGRAYFSSAQNVGEYVMWDFVGQRRRK